ncbi:Pyrroline-5-carboxylate reductase [bioreactor metagenome]|uniref:Pyrroline-5-carboxylate reductase n=1 Tax=bioreactor metagenome TaxID=1076179 RepID=A0A644T870_9ZZZZ|nr:pyrroline-5-carboxylate reductase dimerization domain-containing protein [Methanobrevibacter sp.]MEA4957478.1 NAD(P)-binding domain-containing protein [Methanobrevibacter sp.]
MDKYGFIGYGNMGQMIIENILNLKIFNPEEMIISNRTLSKLDEIKKKYPNISVTDNNIELAKNSSKIFIFVETPEFKDLICQISPFLHEDSHIIHVCAGLSFDNIKNFYNGSITQVIPSISSKFNNGDIDYINHINKNFTKENQNVGSYTKLGVSLILHNKNTLDNDKCLVEEIFNEFSYIQIIDDFEFNINGNNERVIEIATILTSCGPAFFSSIIDNLANIAFSKSENGISIDEAKYLIVKTLLSTLIQINNNNLATDEIIDKTSTKKGITEIGVNYLDKNSNILIEKLFDLLIERYDEVKLSLKKNYS